MKTLNIALLQIAPTGTLNGNLQKGDEYCRKAKAMGADFCAVLTGVSGKEAKEYFENQNSEYIFL